MKTTEEARAVLRAHADDYTQWSMGREVKDSLSDLLDDVEELQAESEAHSVWLEETWPTIEDRSLGGLVMERDEALAKVAALTKERDHLRTTLGYWQGQHFDRVVRERDENEEIAERALATGLEYARQVREWRRGWFGGEDLPDQTR